MWGVSYEVVLLLAEVFDITTQRFGIQQIWIIPAALTLAPRLSQKSGGG